MIKILRKIIFYIFFILIIEIEKMMIIDNKIDIDIKKVKYFIDIFIMIDQLYNLIIYENYEIALSFE